MLGAKRALKVNARRKQNGIERIVRQDGSICTDWLKLEGMVQEFYENLNKAEGTIGIEEQGRSRLRSTIVHLNIHDLFTIMI
jgi:hypothetical protein